MTSIERLFVYAFLIRRAKVVKYHNTIQENFRLF